MNSDYADQQAEARETAAAKVDAYYAAKGQVLDPATRERKIARALAIHAHAHDPSRWTGRNGPMICCETAGIP